jgi:hypothetical protein
MQYLFHPGYDEAAIEELRLNEGKQLLDDLKDSVAKGRSLDIQDEDGATAVRNQLLLPPSVLRDLL